MENIIQNKEKHHIKFLNRAQRKSLTNFSYFEEYNPDSIIEQFIEDLIEIKNEKIRNELEILHQVIILHDKCFINYIIERNNQINNSNIKKKIYFDNRNLITPLFSFEDINEVKSELKINLKNLCDELISIEKIKHDDFLEMIGDKLILDNYYEKELQDKIEHLQVRINDIKELTDTLILQLNNEFEGNCNQYEQELFYYIESIDKIKVDNFGKQIINLYSIEGFLYKNLNNSLRNFVYKNELFLYFILLQGSIVMTDQNSIDEILKRIEHIRSKTDLNKFRQDNSRNEYITFFRAGFLKKEQIVNKRFILNNGFTSTSYDENIAIDKFLRGREIEKGLVKVFFKIDVKQEDFKNNNNFCFIDNFSDEKSEKEVLFPSLSLIQIKEIKKIEETKYVLDNIEKIIKDYYEIACDFHNITHKIKCIEKNKIQLSETKFKFLIEEIIDNSKFLILNLKSTNFSARYIEMFRSELNKQTKTKIFYELDLSENSLNRKFAKALYNLFENCKNFSIYKLNLSCNNLGRQSFTEILNILELKKNFKNLVLIDLSSNCLKEICFIKLKDFLIKNECIYLRDLDLSYNYIGNYNDSINDLIQIINKNSSLVSLKLMNCNFKSSNNDILQSTPNENSNLKSLYLNSNPIKNNFAKALLRVLNKNTIRNVQFSDCKLDDYFLFNNDIIFEMEHLDLALDDNKNITEKGIGYIIQAVKDYQVKNIKKNIKVSFYLKNTGINFEKFDQEYFDKKSIENFSNGDIDINFNY